MEEKRKLGVVSTSTTTQRLEEFLQYEIQAFGEPSKCAEEGRVFSATQGLETFPIEERRRGISPSPGDLPDEPEEETGCCVYIYNDPLVETVSKVLRRQDSGCIRKYIPDVLIKRICHVSGYTPTHH